MSITKHINITKLNEKYAPLSAKERLAQLYVDFDANEVLFTSSFGASALLLLDLVSKVNPKQHVHFIDTTYHFKETIHYKNNIASELGLAVIDLLPEVEDNMNTTATSMWIEQPNACCNVNKLKPLNKIKGNYKVWISGLMGYQTPNRADLPIFLEDDGIIKFHPLVDINQEEAEHMINNSAIPPHPLLAEGYESIGCTHCTLRGNGRDGRWSTQGKTECGLHFTPVNNL